MSKMERTLELLREGPATFDELPGRPMRHRHEVDVRKVSPTAGSSGDYSTGGGAPTQVYYLPDHDRSEVIETFLDANKDWVEGLGKVAAYRRLIFHLGSSWNQTVRDAWEDRGWKKSNRGGDGGSGKGPGTCPFCGEDYELSLPYHLRKDCERGGGDG